jgi:hypothetical protein
MNTLYSTLKVEVSTRKELTPAGNKVQIQTVLGVVNTVEQQRHTCGAA